MYRQLPKLTKDAFWDNIEPEIPYTQAAASYKSAPFYGSTQAMNISERQAEWNMPEPMEAIDEESGLGGGAKMASTSSLRFRKISRKRKDKKHQQQNDDEDVISEITANSSDDEIEDDERSNDLEV
uniref:Uncharacterized protein n=1 Tax=Panagrolaimus superbus TaxID=310955 RepID=A0A914YGE8_9BILA